MVLHTESQPGGDGEGNLAPTIRPISDVPHHNQDVTDESDHYHAVGHDEAGVRQRHSGAHHNLPPHAEEFHTPYEYTPNAYSLGDQGRSTYLDNKAFEKNAVIIEDTEKGAFLSEEERVAAGVTLDPYRPFDNLPEENQRVFTVRATILGLICGTLVNASNVYLGLKSGWTFSANLLGAIVGFAAIKFFSKTFAENFPILGGKRFGPRENNIVQTVATASGGLSNVFVSAYPAMYQLHLLGKDPWEDYWKIVSLTAVGGYFGFFFATPLRKFFIVYVARELNLIFPSPTATAMTIRSMHDAASGATIGKLKMKAMSIAFAVALSIRVVSTYAVGILWEWHPFTWFYIWSGYANQALAVENWGWFLQFTPAFIGSGMLVGLNVSLSFTAGSVIAWGIIGPILVHNGVAFGRSGAVEGDPRWDPIVSFASFSPKFITKDHPSPRYWMLWPGVLAMIAISFTELALQWRVILFASKAIVRGTKAGIYDISVKRGKPIRSLAPSGHVDEVKAPVEDSALPHELVKTWQWLPGLILVIVLMIVVMKVEYGMDVGVSLLSVFLAFFFSFLAIQCTGATDITPLTAASKASQIILGGATKAEGWAMADAQRLNLLGGALANMGANQSTDLVGDFRVGFLLRTPPNQQWLAQGVGTLFAVFLAPLLFALFMKAYPCVLTGADQCAFAAPSVAAWKAVAIAVTDPTFPIPTSSGIFAIVFSIIGVISVLLRHFVWKGRLEWVRRYHPNFMCVALAFVLPQTYYGPAMTMGAIAAKVWTKRNPSSFEVLGYAIAAGLIAGEGIGGVFNAVLQIAGVSGDKYGTQVGCPHEC